jgi:tol-pal system protein YbgF
MTQTAYRAALTAALTVAVLAPVSAQSREQRQMMADLRILQVQAQEMQNMVGAMNQALNEALKALTARLNEQTEASRRSFAEQKSIIDTLSNDLRVVREKLDDNNVRVGSLAQEVDSLRELITAAPRGGGDAPTDPSAGGDPAAAAVSPAPAGLGASPERFWTMAMADYYASDYDIAIQGFTTYLAQFPKTERADDAQFYIGQSHYNAGRYDKAVEAYEMTIRTYPSSDLQAEAYYKLGESYRALKQVDRARTAYQHVIKSYPDSAASTQAQQRIQDLK